MTDLLTMTAVEARAALDDKSISAVELTEAYLGAAQATEALNAYTEITHDKARDMAKASDARLAKGEGGALEGLPIGVKDLFCTEGVETTACSNILNGYKPVYESTVTQNLWTDGAVMLGKLNCDEFAMGSANETSARGKVSSPWTVDGDGQDYAPGGSSGGSAASVAARSSLMATGTDTGGSIRQPAAFCGVVGIKPTYGRCSRRGIVAFASSLDQAGPIARTVEDSALMLQSMVSHDLGDSTSVAEPMPDLMGQINDGIKGLKVGIPSEYTMDGMADEITAQWQEGRKWLEDAGATCVEVSLPHTKYALPTYYIVAPAEASSNLARYDGVRYGARVEGGSLDEMYANTRAAGFGEEVTRRILIGTYVLSAGYYDAYYIKAQKTRRLIQNDFIEVFKEVDLLLTPATPSAAFPLGQKDVDPVTMYLNDVFTVPASLAGVPAMSVPSGLASNGLPLGLQLIAPSFREDTLVKAGRVVEKAAGFAAIASRAAGV
ncbi:MAG: Asp-tRNA(Asn)/Glu-tRNA(Gln) amidotransferase subunit GatA [Alphaproteobacteria bacterium]|nr:Asp-tRNA(Asn)/Glu-tRNA(Gln) amidotransferase subunit GatA [Alphaproteobacteria bacterium]